MRLLLRFIFTLCFLSVVILWGVFLFISWIADPYIYTEIEKIPIRDVGVVLGTSPSMQNGRENTFFIGRIRAAQELYEKWKIRHILVSGDNGTRAYNEPVAMQAALMKAWVPENAITLDYAGFRTLDSIIRAKEIFWQEQFTIVSQWFHNERAIYLARENGIDAIAYNAKSVPFSKAPMVYIREIFARIVALYDARSGRDATILWREENITLTGTIRR